MSTFTLTWPVAELVNLNAERKMHPKARARLVKLIREATAAQAADHPFVTGPVIISARFQWANEHRRDTSNWLPTVKAMVDGLVDAEVLPGDHDAIVRDTRLGADLPAERGLKGYVRIVLSITEECETTVAGDKMVNARRPRPERANTPTGASSNLTSPGEDVAP